MLQAYYTYRIRIPNYNKVLVEKRGPQNEELSLSGIFNYKGKLRETIDTLNQAATNNELKDLKVKDLGEALFNALFDPVLRQDFVNVYNQVIHRDNQLLRVELILDQESMPDVAALPWEFMRVPSEAQLGTIWLATAPDLIFSRYLAQPFPSQSVELQTGDKLRIALAVSAPTDLGPVEYEALHQDLQDWVKQSESQVELLPLVYPARPNLIHEALEREPHILHFIGHARLLGKGEIHVGEVALMNDLNKAWWVDAEYFSDLLNQHRPHVVFLQACQGGAMLASQVFVNVASRVVQQNIPFVVAMQYEISNSTASTFSRRFYQQLAKGYPVDKAAQDGRLNIAHSRREYNTRDFAAPLLFTRIHAGYLFKHSDGNLLSSRLAGSAELTFQNLVKFSNNQLQRYYQEISSPEGHGQYTPFVDRLYVSRHNVEKQINEYLLSNKNGFLLIGDSGVGKTNVLCSLVKQFKEDNHIVFYYNLGGSVGENILSEVAQDLFTTAENLSTVIKEVDTMCGSEGKHFILIFDGLNEYRTGEQLSAGTAVKEIDNLISHNRYEHFRVIAACRKSTWDQLQVMRVTELFWNNYYPGDTKNKFIQLERFEEDELEKAYSKYKSEFDLYSDYNDLSEYTKNRCRDPFILRLLSEIYAGRDRPIPHTAPSYEIISRFYEEKIKRRIDKHFLNEIVVLMYRTRRSKLPIRELQTRESIRSDILNESLDSPYNYLKDVGILAETKGSYPNETNLRFSHDRVLEYVLAQNILAQTPAEKLDSKKLEELASDSKEFYPLWGVTKNVLVIKRDPIHFLDLGRSEDLTVRKIVSESLVDLQADAPSLSLKFMKHMLGSNSETVQRAALEAAYYIGKEAREIFTLAAIHTSQMVREAVKGYLYILWRSDPKFCSDFVEDLLSQINIRAPMKLARLLNFILDYWSLLLINNCWHHDVMSDLSKQIRVLAVEKLHLNTLSQLPAASQVEDVLFDVGGRIVSYQVFKTVMFDEYFPVEKFFLDRSENRDIYNGLVRYIRPETSLPKNILNDLLVMMEAGIPLYKLIAVLIVLGHLLKDFFKYKSLAKDLFTACSPIARYWFVNAFSLYIPVKLPREYVTFIQELTASYLSENRQHFLNVQNDEFYIPGLELTFLPLGLARLMRQLDLNYFEQLFDQVLANQDYDLLAQCIRFFAPIGFYYPEETLNFLAKKLETRPLSIPRVRDAFLTTLATIRTLQLDSVDGFMERENLGSTDRQKVFARTGLELVKTHLYALGLYNNAINMMLWHPKLRETLSFSIYEILADCEGVNEFVSSYSRRIYDSFKEEDWQLINLYDFDQEDLEQLKEWEFDMNLERL